jgi:hypothetical protein
VDEEPIPSTDPSPENRHCAICGTAHALFGFGPPGTLSAEAWYCRQHRQDGERAWAARYHPPPAGPSGGRLM